MYPVNRRKVSIGKPTSKRTDVLGPHAILRPDVGKKRKVRLVEKKASQKKTYKVPKTSKSSGIGWGP